MKPKLEFLDYLFFALVLVVLSASLSAYYLHTRAVGGDDSAEAVRAIDYYRGVHWDKTRDKWCAFVSLPGQRTKNLGRFHSEEMAGKAYDAAAIVQFGEFAQLNFPKL